MPFEVKLPDIGEGVAEGEIVRWLVQVGDAVKEDQPLVEVMTDKASVEIPSPRTGTIVALLAEEGQVVPVGTTLITIEVAGEASPAAVSAPSSPARAEPAPRATAPVTGAAVATTPGVRIQATPAVRELAKRLRVGLEALTGTGPGGAITADDVQRAAQTPAPGHKPERPAPPSVDAGGEQRIPLRGLRRKIAEHMRHSLDTAAHFTFVAECDLTAVVEHRERAKAKANDKGIALTYLAYVVRALIEPLRQFPLLNASLDDARGEIVLKRGLHLGIATATDQGLTVPVIHDADRKSLFELASEIQRLAAAARAGKLTLEELQGGTFTITSTGARGGLLATPILHHPQVAILGVHEVKKKPAVVEGRIVPRDLTNLSLSLDHRVVDGAVGADFLYAVVARLEAPASWLGDAEVG
ncbi:MAG TPA: dihydrolipoamide acetyltransferase family protein [Candidatus Limnocylindria bacterium]|nr:dihydrolipoamide acetyltransferase family protein [Candidatus Limnocylindria bacterium]